MENVGQANFFQFFHEFLRKFYFSRKWWKKLAWPTFSTIFMIPKTSSKILGKSWPGQHFPRFGLPKRLESWKMLARPTFSTIFVVYKTVSEIRGKSGKSWPGHVFKISILENVGQANFFHHFRDLQNFLRNCLKVGRVSFFKSH